MQKKLAFTFIGFAILPLLVLTWFLLVYTHKSHSLTLAQDASRLIKADVEYAIKERLRDLKTFTLTRNLWEHTSENLESFSNTIVASHPDYRLVLGVNKEGIVDVVSTNDKSLMGKSFERSSWFQRSLTTDEPILETPRQLEFIKSVVSNAPVTVLPIAQAIRDKEGEITGVWVIFSDAEFLQKTVQSVIDALEIKGHFEITDHAGLTLAQVSNQTLSEYETATELLQFAGQSWYIKSSIEQVSIIEDLRDYAWPLVVFLGLIIMYAFVAARRLMIPLYRLIDYVDQRARGGSRVELPYLQRKDEYGKLARVLAEIQPSANGVLFGSAQEDTLITARRIDETEQLVKGLSAQANMLALNASMEAVNAHHLDPVAESANEMAQTTSYNSQELLKKLNEIKGLCNDIQNKNPQSKAS